MNPLSNKEMPSEETDDSKHQSFTNHTSIYAKTEHLNEGQIRNILNAAKQDSLAAIGSFIESLTDSDKISEWENYRTDVSNASFDINVVLNPIDKSHYGHSYIWVNNSHAMHHILSGKSPDGQIILKTIIDPKYTGPPGFNPSHSKDDYKEYRAELDTYIQNMIVEGTHGMPTDSDMYREKVKSITFDNQPQTIKVPSHERFVKLSSVAFDEKQKEFYIQKIIKLSTPVIELYAEGDELEAQFVAQKSDSKDYCSNINELRQQNRDDIIENNKSLKMLFGDAYVPIPTEWDDEWDNMEQLPVFIPDNYVYPNSCSIETSISSVNLPKSTLNPRIIYCRFVPGFVELKTIKDLMSKYSSITYAEKVLDEKGNVTSVTYPLVKKNKNKDGLDIFGESTSTIAVNFKEISDARFALQMIRQLRLSVPESKLAEIRENYEAGLAYLKGRYTVGDQYRVVIQHCIKNMKPYDWEKHINTKFGDLVGHDKLDVRESDRAKVCEAVLHVKTYKYLKSGFIPIQFNFFEINQSRQRANGNRRGRGGGRGRGRGRGGGRGRGETRRPRYNRPVPASLPPPNVEITEGPLGGFLPPANDEMSFGMGDLTLPMGFMEMSMNVDERKPRTNNFKPHTGNAWKKPLVKSKPFQPQPQTTFNPILPPPGDNVSDDLVMSMGMNFIGTTKEDTIATKPFVFQPPKPRDNAWLKPISKSKAFNTTTTTNEFFSPQTKDTSDEDTSLMMGINYLFDTLSSETAPVPKFEPEVEPEVKPVIKFKPAKAPLVNAWSKTLEHKKTLPPSFVPKQPKKDEIAFGTFAPVKFESVKFTPPPKKVVTGFRFSSTVKTPVFNKTISSLPM
jgi:hypothetical protein